MKKFSVHDFLNDSERILAQVQKGQRLILTRGGRPVARLEPTTEALDADDPIYSLADFAGVGEPLSNSHIDEILYGD